MRCDIDPDKVSADQPNDDEDIEQIEANGRNNEQVYGGDARCVVASAPSLGRRSTSLHHIFRDAGLSDLEAELEQLAMNARRTPQRIFRAHPTDQRAQFRIDPRSASKRARFPPPVPTKAGSMPVHEGLGPPARHRLKHSSKPRLSYARNQPASIRKFDATLPRPLHDRDFH